MARNLSWRDRSQLRRLRQCDWIVITAHPDDETLWAGATIASHPGTGILCVTNRSVKTRRQAFERAVAALGARGAITDVPDRRSAGITTEDANYLRVVVRQALDYRPARVITHAPEGEYGHVFHQALSSLVTEEAVRLAVPVWYFDFTDASSDDRAPLGIPAAKQAALDAYFDPDRGIEDSDLLHIELSRYECPTPAHSYAGPSALIAHLYGRPSTGTP